ncbi:MAG: hypothetical protein ACOCWX_06005 [Spirochaetota bacterium]
MGASSAAAKPMASNARGTVDGSFPSIGGRCTDRNAIPCRRAVSSEPEIIGAGTRSLRNQQRRTLQEVDQACRVTRSAERGKVKAGDSLSLCP